MMHPVAQTVHRGRDRRHAECHLGIGIHCEGDAREWVPLVALTDDPERLLAVLDLVGHEVGSIRRGVQASLFLESYAWRLLLPLAGALLAERRVAAPAVQDVLLRVGEGRPAELRLVPGGFTVLGDDPEAAHHDAAVAATPAALVAAFERALVEHFTVVVEALNAVSRRSKRVLWRAIGDRTATALLHAGLALGDPRAGERVAHQVLRDVPPFHMRATYTTLESEKGPLRVHLRCCCCLWWRTAAATRCTTCPLADRAGTERSAYNCVGGFDASMRT